MRVIVYVEGLSDGRSMEAVLRPLLDKKRQEGIVVDFFVCQPGCNKDAVLRRVPLRAVDILRNQPDTIVIAMPDLYPPNGIFPHETVDQMFLGLHRVFEEALNTKGLGDSNILKGRFKVFCFKHDLESLVLASHEALFERLGIRSTGVRWTIPVEEQNHGTPPKRVVERLFETCGRQYRDTIDAPMVLGAISYYELAERCPQCFKPFVEFIERLPDVS